MLGFALRYIIFLLAWLRFRRLSNASTSASVSPNAQDAAITLTILSRSIKKHVQIAIMFV
jgi:hypothetical protein